MLSLLRNNNDKKFFLLAVFALAAAGVFMFSAAKAEAALINAIGVLGQTNYTSSTVNSPNGSFNTSGFGGFVSVALDTINHRLFVSDWIAYRILVFNSDASNNIVSISA